MSVTPSRVKVTSTVLAVLPLAAAAAFLGGMVFVLVGLWVCMCMNGKVREKRGSNAGVGAGCPTGQGGD
jgi:hypothetical protein